MILLANLSAMLLIAILGCTTVYHVWINIRDFDDFEVFLFCLTMFLVVSFVGGLISVIASPLTLGTVFNLAMIAVFSFLCIMVPLNFNRFMNLVEHGPKKLWKAQVANLQKQVASNNFRAADDPAYVLLCDKLKQLQDTEPKGWF